MNGNYYFRGYLNVNNAKQCIDRVSSSNHLTGNVFIADLCSDYTVMIKNGSFDCIMNENELIGIMRDRLPYRKQTVSYTEGNEQKTKTVNTLSIELRNIAVYASDKSTQVATVSGTIKTDYIESVRNDVHMINTLVNNHVMDCYKSYPINWDYMNERSRTVTDAPDNLRRRKRQ